MATPDRIVDFDNPPVAEVALSVQFSEPIIDATGTLGDFWPRIKDEYSKFELQPRMPPMEESFEVPSQPTVAFNFVGGPEVNRYFFISADDTEVVQVQPDRFGYNWRKANRDDVPYPHYTHVRKRFVAVFTAFLEMLDGHGVEVTPTWCEIVYVNPIPGVAGEARRDLSEIMRRVSSQELSTLPKPFNAQISERFQLQRDGEPFARFYIELDPTFTNDALGYQLTLVMRGTPRSRDVDGVLAFFDEGREKIVTTFREITTDTRHEEWRLR